jgi:death-on-curing protein
LHQLIFLHTVAIVEFGGAEGIRDRGGLESALARPLAGFGEERPYRTPFQRAAALMEGLLRNHGFIDGKKRVAVLAASFWLEREGYELTAPSDDVVDVTLAVIDRRLSLEELGEWLERFTRPLRGAT